MISTDDHIFSTTFKPDGTARNSLIREGTSPSEDDRAWADAIRIANSFEHTKGQRLEGAADAHFEQVCPPNPADERYRELVRDAYRKELELRTNPEVVRQVFGKWRTSIEG